MALARSVTGWQQVRFRSGQGHYDWTKPLLDGALGPGSASQNLIRILQLAAEAYGFSLSTPFEQLPRKTQNLVLYGPEPGEKKRGGFLGVFAYLRQAMEDSSSEGYRDWLLDHTSATTCPACGGKRLRPESLAVKVNGMSIADFTALPVSRAVEAAAQIKLNQREERIADESAKRLPNGWAFSMQ